jgi:tetratricopeptide (TPR) repeat protein
MPMILKIYCSFQRLSEKGNDENATLYYGGYVTKVCYLKFLQEEKNKSRFNIAKGVFMDFNEYIRQGGTFLQEGKTGQTLENFEAALKLQPNNTDLQQLVEMLKRDAGKIAELQQKEAEACVNEAKSRAEVMEGLFGVKLEEITDVDKIIMEYTQAPKCNHASAKNILGLAYYIRGLLFDSKREYAESVKAYSEAINNEPDYPFAFNNRGRANLNIGKIENCNRAVEDFKKANLDDAQLKKRLADVYYQRALMYDRRGDSTQAVKDCNRALEYNPGDSYASELLSMAEEHERKKREEKERKHQEWLVSEEGQRWQAEEKRKQEEERQRAAEEQERREREKRERKEREKHERQEEEKRKAAKKRKKRLLVVSVAIIIIIICGYFAFQYGRNLSVYRKAEAAMTNGDHETAIEYYQTLGDFRDARMKLFQITDIPSVIGEISEKSGKTVSWQDLTNGVLSHLIGAGWGTAVLRADGTVVDTQRNVSGWANIIAIFGSGGGGGGIAGLQKDGTVVGNWNTDNKRDVSSWKNIIAVSVGAFHTVGLRADGTVVAVGGSNRSGECNVSDWKNIIAVSAGASQTVGLQADGTVVGTDSIWVSDWKNIVAVSAGGNHSVGLRADGTVVVQYNRNTAPRNIRRQHNVNKWKNIVAVSAGNSHTVGLRADGMVVATGYNGYGQCNVSGWKNIIAVSAGVMHTVGLRADGTIVVAGDKDSKRNVSDWNIDWKKIVIDQADRNKVSVTQTPSITPQNDFQATHKVITNDGSSLRLRNAQGFNASQIGSLDYGSYVMVLNTGEAAVDNDGYRGNWTYVLTPNGRKGWCFGAYLQKR